MANVCKLDHSADGLPAYLCRACHPELIPTPDELAKAEARERDQRNAEAAERERKRELERTERKLALLTKRKPEPGTVNAKLVESLERKAQRIKDGGPSRLRTRHHISAKRKLSPKGKRHAKV